MRSLSCWILKASWGWWSWCGGARKYQPSGCFSPLDMIRLLVPSFHRGIVRAGRQQAEEHHDVPYQRLIHSQVLLCTGRPQLRRKRSLSGYRGLPPDTLPSAATLRMCVFSQCLHRGNKQGNSCGEGTLLWSESCAKPQ